MSVNPDVHTMVNELTNQHTHTETYTRDQNGEIWSGQRHVTDVPALVHQLFDASPASQATESTSPGFGPRAAGRIEAIDTIMLIDDEAARWVRNLGDDDPGDTLHPITRKPIPGSGTIACIRRVYALRAGLAHDDPQRRDIETDIRRWWRQARIISGWDSPAWRPDNTCPVCEQRRSLRVNLTLHTAFCVECRSDWGPEEIGVLAEHIRGENADVQEAS